jgi:hypothetical protein
MNIYDRVINILLEFKGLNLETRRKRVNMLSNRGMARANAAAPPDEPPSDEELDRQARDTRREEVIARRLARLKSRR